jgi:hypothetical protein
MDALIVFGLSLAIYFFVLGIANGEARRALRNNLYMVRPKK